MEKGGAGNTERGTERMRKKNEKWKKKKKTRKQRIAYEVTDRDRV